jgi:hypothetical protein
VGGAGVPLLMPLLFLLFPLSTLTTAVHL